MSATETKQHRLLSVMLAFLLVVYTAGVLNGLLVWVGGQNLDPNLWHLESLPAYIIVFILGDVSALTALKWRKFGLIGLVATWAFTGVLYLLFGAPFPTLSVTFPTILLLVAFFYLPLRLSSLSGLLPINSADL